VEGKAMAGLMLLVLAQFREAAASSPWRSDNVTVGDRATRLTEPRHGRRRCHRFNRWLCA
jgi:hypothetical protein